MSPSLVGRLPLTPSEELDLKEAEREIERNLQGFVAAGEALLTIREGRLYREEYGTFEAYCQQRWGLARTRAYELMDAADTARSVSEISDIGPRNEGQAKALRGLAPDQAADVMRRAHETTGGHVTARAIRDARQPGSEPKPDWTDARAALDQINQDIEDDSPTLTDEPGQVTKITGNGSISDPRPSPEATRRHEAEQAAQTSRENGTIVIARAAFQLDIAAGHVDPVRHVLDDWQRHVDNYGEPTTARRLRTAGQFLFDLAEEWPS